MLERLYQVSYIIITPDFLNLNRTSFKSLLKPYLFTDRKKLVKHTDSFSIGLLCIETIIFFCFYICFIFIGKNVLYNHNFECLNRINRFLCILRHIIKCIIIIIVICKA